MGTSAPGSCAPDECGADECTQVTQRSGPGPLLFTGPCAATRKPHRSICPHKTTNSEGQPRRGHAAHAAAFASTELASFRRRGAATLIIHGASSRAHPLLFMCVGGWWASALVLVRGDLSLSFPCHHEESGLSLPWEVHAQAS